MAATDRLFERSAWREIERLIRPKGMPFVDECRDQVLGLGHQRIAGLDDAARRAVEIGAGLRAVPLTVRINVQASKRCGRLTVIFDVHADFDEEPAVAERMILNEHRCLKVQRNGLRFDSFLIDENVHGPRRGNDECRNLDDVTPVFDARRMIVKMNIATHTLVLQAGKSLTST